MERTSLSAAASSVYLKSRDGEHDPLSNWTSRDRSRHAKSTHEEPDDDQSAPVPPASPEVISSLITSLSAISRPVSNHFDGPSYLSPIGIGSPLSSVPGSPTGGSFGVDYGTYNQPSLKELQEEDEIPLDELPASPPIVRTSKLPTSLSTLTAPKSPRSPGARESTGFLSIRSRRSSGGVSRPSSRGSFTSGAESIGKPSVERVSDALSPPRHSLRKQKSYDSWGFKGHRSLIYMGSKEKLRDKATEKKRASIGAVGGDLNILGSKTEPPTPRLQPSFTDSVINEEPATIALEASALQPAPVLHDSLPSPGLIPTRDSSLRKTGNNAKRSSARTSRHSRKDSESDAYGAIPELDEQNAGPRDSRSEKSKRRHSGRKQNLGLDPLRLSADLAKDAPLAGPSTPAAAMFPDGIDDGAPSPAVAQGRRRDREASIDFRRRSGRLTPDPFGGYASEGGNPTVKLKRSSTRLKRRSGAATPTSEKSGAGGSNYDHPHVAYERPRSADSIDDAVESYLCSPRLSQKIRHPQTGRVISFSEVGDPNGSAVFCCVGMGLTRYITAFYDELALTLKLRLITPDRPGVGDSEPYPDGNATPLGWPGWFIP